MNHPDELCAALGPIVSILRALEVRHYIGGSVASSFHGAARSTMDVDVVCEIGSDQVSDFVQAIPAAYYANEQSINEAISRRSCFNLIHIPTSFKVDVFVSRGRPFDQDCMDRSAIERLNGELEVAIASAEDTIIAKLEWYKLGDEVSERQWDDVSKLIQVLGERADVEYLRRSAESVGVAQLLKRLLRT